jgi:uncharacterized protein DUF6923/PEP-CTERM motif-containing protein
MKLLHLIFSCVALLAISTQAHAVKLYASTAAGASGELYLLNPANGDVTQDIGPTNDINSVNYPITGLAFHPTTGVLYGSTGNSPEATGYRLVTIDPSTGLVTVIGLFNAGPVNSSDVPATMADLAFDRDGNLYGIGSIGGPQLYSINTTTGQATAIGSTGLTSTSGGGLAISRGGVFYGTPTSSRFGTYVSGTGAYTNIGNPVKPVGGAYAALAFNNSGVLYGLDLGPDSTGKPTQLVTINRTNAAVTPLGTGSLAQLDAIAFQIPEPASLVLCVAGLAVALVRRRR